MREAGKRKKGKMKAIEADLRGLFPAQKRLTAFFNSPGGTALPIIYYQLVHLLIVTGIMAHQ